MLIKLLTWNIWRGKNLDQVLSFLLTQNADIIGLQEIIETEDQSVRKNTAEIIAAKLGYQYAYCKAFTTDRHETVYDIGNAILSKFPIKKSICHILSGFEDYQKNSETEPRGAVEAHFKIGDTTLKVFSIHLAYSHQLLPFKLRKKQIRNLLQLVQNENTIVLGDFNSSNQNPEMEQLQQKFVNADPHPLQPTWSVTPVNYKGFEVQGLEFRIDHIFASKNLKVTTCNVEKTIASDHLPVSAIIEI